MLTSRAAMPRLVMRDPESYSPLAHDSWKGIFSWHLKPSDFLLGAWGIFHFLGKPANPSDPNTVACFHSSQHITRSLGPIRQIPGIDGNKPVGCGSKCQWVEMWVYKYWTITTFRFFRPFSVYMGETSWMGLNYQKMPGALNSLQIHWRVFWWWILSTSAFFPESWSAETTLRVNSHLSFSSSNRDRHSAKG